MKVALIGYGKMGKAIDKLLPSRNHLVVSRFGRDGIDLEELKEADVAIEFTRPEAAVSNLSSCFKVGVPVVSGTTGWLAQFDEIVKLCKNQKAALLYASNFSIGVNIMFHLNKKLGAIMNHHSDYEVEIEEIHHTQKLDAPSGTAISLAEQLIEQLKNKEGWTLDKPLNSKQIHIEAKREAEVPGTHRVSFKSGIDTIELAHIAHSRDGFALGAILAAEFLQSRQGIYTMNDVLNI